MKSDMLVAEDVIFALDIGTRTIIGIVGVHHGDKFKVVASEIMEHGSRAMMDGQVHDIEMVAALANKVKEALAKKTGLILTRVAVAAAGRVLQTRRVRVERSIDSNVQIDKEFVSSLEMEGIQLAQMKIDQEAESGNNTSLYCVGYGVINYILNDYEISSLIGHKGRKAGADVLATFLPHIVVDSLYTVMDRIGLEVTSLTLEPIAAINVAIPKELRMLNLALVDIGAGTSDIAITKGGSVVAYAMAPIAGDEVTEFIAQSFLVDFNTAEKIKISLKSNHNITFTDIMGTKYTKSSDEIQKIIIPAVEELADVISEKIIEYNGKAPNAVFLIGGGSQILGLTEIIAQKLNLPKERVAVRGRETIQNIKFSGKKLSGPEAITPIGIAVTAYMQQGKNFFTVTINQKKVKLFNSKKLVVADALLLIGFDPTLLIGRSGKSLSFEYNGEKKTIRGGYGTPSEVYINEKTAHLESELKPGDDIVVKPATKGEDAVFTIADLRLKYSENEAVLLVNGNAADDNYIIQMNDNIETSKSIVLSIETDEAANNEAVEESNGVISAKVEAVEASYEGIDVYVNGKKVLINSAKSEHIYVDVFNFIDFNLSNPQGRLVLKLNGQPAAYTDIIRHGDSIEIYWE